MVKPDADRLATVPAAPPVAGPDRAPDLPPPGPGARAKPLLEVEELLLAAAGLLLEVALTMP